MEWLSSLFIEHSALQAVIILSLISAIGLGLGKIHICGISLGVTFVFFAGILAGHLRTLYRSTDVELCREFRAYYLCICIGTASWSRLF